MLLEHTLSIIVPAYNEAGNIELALDDLLDIIKGNEEKVEIIVINDGSKDNTGEIAEGYARKHPSVRVHHNNPNRGLGYSYKKGVESAEKEYIMMVPGDREICKESIRTIISLTGQADIIIPFIQNRKKRSWVRQGISKLFTMTVNLISGLNITYYNGPVIHSAKLLKAQEIKTAGFAYQAELLVKMILNGASIIQVSMLIQPREFGAANALKAQNFLRVGRTLLSLCKYVYLTRGKRGL